MTMTVVTFDIKAFEFSIADFVLHLFDDGQCD